MMTVTPWEPHEDTVLLEARARGLSFELIARVHLPHRSRKSCASRSLLLRRNPGGPPRPTNWTDAEDKRLLAAQALGPSWSVISEDFVPGRSVKSCQQRYCRLQQAPMPVRQERAKPLSQGQCGLEIANRSLVQRQLATNQCSWPMRAAWVERHGAAL